MKPVSLAKLAEESRWRVHALIKVAAAVGNEVRAPGILRTQASASWRVGGNPPRPKSTRPGKAKDMPTAKPPSKTSFFSDMAESLADPKRGFRITLPQR